MLSFTGATTFEPNMQGKLIEFKRERQHGPPSTKGPWNSRFTGRMIRIRSSQENRTFLSDFLTQDKQLQKLCQRALLVLIYPQGRRILRFARVPRLNEEVQQRGLTPRERILTSDLHSLPFSHRRNRPHFHERSRMRLLFYASRYAPFS